ncbi:ABC transporter substrate-binding protein [Bradyrhizobium diazoefficiens]|uniref:ABC transporter substrate-binding protein n=1 Tax=Bradyrhizobium diazoefficiens TaxID=1355477 RepID=UPI001909F2CD|nr:ABC transporter substrate-binding protein [Bradyrhizobium diazoefficiens]MBK3664091.1 ABC transporter substrate-binding protein [Bradyrhizobium diazoefficiens]
MQRRRFLKVYLGATAMAAGLAGRTWAQSRPRRVGVLVARPEASPEGKDQQAAFESGLAELGWKPGQNVEIHFRWETPDAAKRQAFVRELVTFKPDVLVINSTPYLRITQKEAGSIPIVFVAIADPVAQGFVRSLSRPGGTMTGFGVEEPGMGSKWMELLKECAPDTRSVTAVYNPNTAPMAPLFFPSIEAVKSPGLFDLIRAPVKTEDELENAIVSTAGRPGPGLIFLPDSYLASRADTIVASVAKHRVPAVYSISAFARNGGLIALGIERADIFRRAASYVDRILKGEKPSDLPVQMPDKFELILNLKTARSLGLAIPATLVARADEVIE